MSTLKDLMLSQFRLNLWDLYKTPLLSDSGSAASRYGGMGGYYGSTCSHESVSIEEFVAQCTELFGGSFQTLYQKLEARGYKVVKTS